MKATDLAVSGIVVIVVAIGWHCGGPWAMLSAGIALVLAAGFKGISEIG